VFCKIIKENKGFSVVFNNISQYKKSCVAKYKELMTQAFSITLSFKSFLVIKAV
jgi:hypothetical protein